MNRIFLIIILRGVFLGACSVVLRKFFDPR